MRHPLRACIAPAAALALAACTELRAFELTEPAAQVTLDPTVGEHMHVAWTFDADGADDIGVVVQVVPVDGSFAPRDLEWGTLDAGGLEYVIEAPDYWTSDPPAPTPPPGTYQIRAYAREDGFQLVSFAPGVLVMNGPPP